jgi:hypothetical protein
MLTTTKINRLKIPTKIERHIDSDGLYLELTPSGSKSWRYRHKNFAGSWTMKSLGKYPLIRPEFSRHIPFSSGLAVRGSLAHFDCCEHAFCSDYRTARYARRSPAEHRSGFDTFLTDFSPTIESLSSAALTSCATI